MTTPFLQLYIPIVIVCTAFITEVFAEICDDGMRCPTHKYCCSSGTGCCYEDHDDGRYGYGYRLSIWNMWYFWFIVLFVLMACFSGCGYYKQRQRILRDPHAQSHGGLFSMFPGSGRLYRGDVPELAGQDSGLRHNMRSQGNGPGRFWSIFQVPTGLRRSNFEVDTGYQSSHGFRGAVITNPTINTSGATLQPPPYSEVINNPDLFPSNLKTDLPPYSQQPVVTPNTETGAQSGETNTVTSPPQPPPYSEVANQQAAEELTANQISQGATNQISQNPSSH